MFIDSIVYLIEHYWIYLLIAALIGIVTGWVSAAPSSH